MALYFVPLFCDCTHEEKCGCFKYLIIELAHQLQCFGHPVVLPFRSAVQFVSYGERFMMPWITDLLPHPATKRP